MLQNCLCLPVVFSRRLSSLRIEFSASRPLSVGSMDSTVIQTEKFMSDRTAFTRQHTVWGYTAELANNECQEGRWRLEFSTKFLIIKTSYILIILPAHMKQNYAHIYYDHKYSEEKMGRINSQILTVLVFDLWFMDNSLFPTDL